MPIVVFQPGDRRVEVSQGMDLLTASRKAGIGMEAPCGGKGTCGRCLVQVVSGETDKGHMGMLSSDIIEDGFVLACRTRVRDTDLVVATTSHYQPAAGKFTDLSADLALIDAALFPAQADYQPLTVKRLWSVPLPGTEAGNADTERLAPLFRQNYPDKEIRYPLAVLAKMADTLRVAGGQVTLTLAAGPAAIRVVDMESGDRTHCHFGLAVDIGTTTVAVQLVDLATGKSVGSVCDYNSQLVCGLDVISRINYAHNAERLAELQTRVVETLNLLIRQLLADAGLAADAVSAAVLSGNTVMVHLLLGLKPEYIRLAPYTPTVLAPENLTAGELGLAINPRAILRISPCVGSYVGGDITAGLLCSSLADARDTEEIRLYMDIGTNGELVLGNSEFLMTCACSAGPAFEGSGIECGMRAAPGAIERVHVDPATGMARLEIIGSAKASGICGSGIISLLAGLFGTGWLTADGKLRRDKASPAIRIEGRKARYLLYGEALWVSEQDIDNIIRAKAAIFAACSLLLSQVGLDFTSLAAVYVAGGFGRFLNLHDAKCLGLLPDLPDAKFHFIGNASLAGSYMTLLSAAHREKQALLMRRMTYLDLSTTPGYMDEYTAALFLPHTDLGLFPSVTAGL